MKESFEKQWPAAKTYDSLCKPILLFKSPSNSKEKTPTALSYKMLEAKKDQHFHWKIKFYHKKPKVFIEKQSWMTKKPRAPWKINDGHPKWKNPFEKQWPAAKTYDSLCKPILLLQKAFKLQEKNAHSIVLQNAWS